MNKIIGILAEKLNHSLSPHIHNYWSKKQRVKQSYKKFEVKEDKLDHFFGEFKKNKNIKGFNITIPYKESCLTYCNRLSQRAKKIGSVNLIYKKDDLIIGDNTDAIGFSKCYNSVIATRPKNVLLIGAGGASRAILYFLNKKNVENIDIFAPSLKRKKGLKDNFRFRSFTNRSPHLKKKYDLIINASSAGMVGKVKLNRNILKLVKNTKSVIDIVYNPLMTDLLNEAQKHNIKFIGGLKMLVEQAKPSFEKWTGKKIALDKEIYEIIKKQL